MSNWTLTFGNAADSRTVTLDGYPPGRLAPRTNPLRTAVGPSDAKPAPPIGSPWSPLDRHSTPIGPAVPLLVGALTHGTGPSRGWNGSNRCTRRTGFSHGRAGLRCSNGVVCRRCGHAFHRLVAHVLAAARAWGRMSCASVKSAPSVQTRARTRARTPRWTCAALGRASYGGMPQ